MKILTSVIASTVLASGLFAYGNGMQGNCNMQNNQGKNYNSAQNYKGGNYNCVNNYQNSKMMKRGSGYSKGMGVLRIVRQLDLTVEQRNDIRDIILKTRAKKQTIGEAFTKSSFDKDKYIKIVTSKRENMIKLKAQMIEDIYNVLTNKQKEQFKVLLDLRTSRYKG
ncbi:Spy/CpxP family protein refolding chaperone [Malaciobacter canalis]|uniref:Spy/CpxP family protein refolding chaperone n=1 Tax=Malaciobacter canalis TaxID=1912871 RepID=UPI00384C314B